MASRERAQELATTAAERVYRSDAIKKAIEGLAAGVGKEIGKRIELAVLDTAGPATQCMQAFLGRRYGTTVARVVSSDAGKEYSIDPSKAGAQVSTGQVLSEGSGGIAGTVVLVVRRQLSNMAARIGQRVIGSILSRLVSVVAGGIGLVLIAKDIWDFRHGVLPIVATEMKSKATKDKVREEIAKTISEHIGDSLKEISDKTAERVVEIWLEFRRAHAKVLEFADRNEAFKRFLDTIRPSDLPRLDEVVALVLASEGEAGVTKRLADGTLNRLGDGAAAGRARHRPRGPFSGNGAASGRPLPAPACPRSSNTRSTAAPRPKPSPRPGCSACSRSRTGLRSRGSRRCSRPPANPCSSWTAAPWSGSPAISTRPSSTACRAT